MSVPTGDDAAVLQTIAELRSDVNRLIDEQLARVRALEEKRVAEPAPERRFSAPSPAPTPPPSPAPRAPRPPAASRLREVVEAPPKPDTDDPSQRLDALARHLDGRLRRSNGRAKASEDSPESPPRRPAGGNGTASEATQ
jgi:hypothetical protein